MALAAVLTGCRGEPGVDLPEDAEVLRLGAGAEPQALDPHLVTGHGEHRILSALFEGLTTLDQETLELEPGAAASWEVSNDGLTYTFHLQAEGRWSNGDPVTAQDFVYGWRRILTPSLGSEYSYMLWILENAEAYNKGDITDFSEVGVKALDDKTLEVRLKYPAPYFLSMLIHYSWFPIHRETIEQYGGIDERLSKWTQPGNMVSNGPFKLAAWAPNQLIQGVRNDHYWDEDEVKLDAVNFYPIESLVTEEREFRAGNLHMTYAFPLTKTNTYREEHPDLLRIEPFVSTYYYRFNVTREPLDDPRVRRALAMAIDKRAIAEDVSYDTVYPAPALTPPDLAGYTAEAGIEFDPEAARELLAEAGYSDGEGFPELELLYNSSEDHKRIAEAIQNMWQKHLNIPIGTNNQDWKVYLASMTSLDYDIARSGWIADYLDPINFLECFVTDGGNNRTGWSNEEYDGLIEEARRTLDEEERRALYQEAERILLEEAPIAPVYYYTQRFLKAPELKGAKANKMGYLNFKSFYLEE